MFSALCVLCNFSRPFCISSCNPKFSIFSIKVYLQHISVLFPVLNKMAVSLTLTVSVRHKLNLPIFRV